MCSHLQKYVLITGAASDIGTSIAIRLSQEYHLLLSDLDEEHLKETARKCHEASDIRILPLSLDETGHIEASLARYLQDHDITVAKFVHCAGVAKRVPLRMMKADYFLEAFQVNVVSAALIIKTLISKKNGKALDSAVLIASIAAVRGVRTFSVYGSTKAAVTGLVRNLAVELAPNVRINAISPGSVRTRATEHLLRERLDEINAGYPLGTGLPEDLAGTVRFLLSEDAKWITGQNLVVDGGKTIDGTE